MIGRFRDQWLEEFFLNDIRNKKIPREIESRLFRKLQMIDDASGDEDLRAPPSNGFEKLSGHLKDWHAIRVNLKWRIIFRWDGQTGEAWDVYLDDHSYR